MSERIVALNVQMIVHVRECETLCVFRASFKQNQLLGKILVWGPSQYTEKKSAIVIITLNKMYMT